MLSAQGTRLLALGVLAAAGIALAVAALLCWRRTRFTLAQAPLLAFGQVMTRVVWRTRIEGRLSLVPGQGAVIVSNHRSPVDPAFIALLTDRIVHWMVAREYVERPWLAWFFLVCRSIPVSRRGTDTAATKAAIRYAQRGGLVGVFPEGRINTTRELLLPGRPGAAMIALKAQVPVVPCYVSGAPYDGTTLGCLLMPAKVRLAVGQPIDLSAYYGRQDERQVLEELTRRFLAEIARLAGQPDFQPKLAGRFYRGSREGENSA